MKEINITFENDTVRFDDRVSILIVMPFVPRIGDLISLSEDQLRKVRNIIRKASADEKPFAKLYDAAAIETFVLVIDVEFRAENNSIWIELSTEEGD